MPIIKKNDLIILQTNFPTIFQYIFFLKTSLKIIWTRYFETTDLRESCKDFFFRNYFNKLFIFFFLNTRTIGVKKNQDLS